MNMVWWLPTAVLAVGSVLVYGRLRVLQHQVAASALAVQRVQDTGTAVRSVAEASQRTRSERSRIARDLPPGAGR